MNRCINALFTKHKKKHLPSFLQGTWFDEWMILWVHHVYYFFYTPRYALRQLERQRDKEYA